MTIEGTQQGGHSQRTSLWYRSEGRGPNLVLISGLNGKASFWDSCRAKLARDRRVLTFDQRGCGASPDDGAPWSIKTMASDVMELADEVFDSEPYSVIGHSTGGAIAQCILAERPRKAVAGILSATWSRADAYMRALFNLRLALTARAPNLDGQLGHLLRASPDAFTPMDPDVPLPPDVSRRRMQALLAHDGERHLPRIAAPVLSIGAADDRVVPPHVVREMHDRAVDSTLTIFERGGHFFPQTSTDCFLRTVIPWLDTHQPVTV